MINEALLLDTLVGLTENTRVVFGSVYAIKSELVALRETVRGLDPTFGEVLDAKREKHPDEALLQSIRLLDQAIQKLKTDLIQ
jgi:hypothetical protein